MLIMAALVLLGITGPDAKATSPSAVVSLPFCVGGSGGTIDAPPNTPISLRLGWFTSPKGAVKDFLQSEILTISINGVPVENAGSHWGPILKVDEDVWGVVWLYSTGISLTRGEIMTVSFSLSISHTPTEIDPETGERTFFGPAHVFGPTEICTIT